jgi:hypothetical protein
VKQACRCRASPICSLLRTMVAREQGVKGDMVEVTNEVSSQQDETLTLQGLERRCRCTGADFFALLISGRSVPVPA